MAKLINNGDVDAPLNWGDMNIVLKPGETTFELGPAIAAKFKIRFPFLDYVSEEIEEISQEQDQEETKQDEAPKKRGRQRKVEL